MLGQPTETETYLGFNADDGQSRAIIASVGCLRAWDHGREQNWSKLHPGRRFYNIFALTATKEIYPSIIKHIIASPSLVYFVTISPLNRQEKSYIPIQSAILFSTCLEPCQRSSPGIRRGLGDKRRPHQIRHRRQGNLQDFLTATNSTRKKKKNKEEGKERTGQGGDGKEVRKLQLGLLFFLSLFYFTTWILVLANVKKMGIKEVMSNHCAYFCVSEHGGLATKKVYLFICRPIIFAWRIDRKCVSGKFSQLDATLGRSLILAS